MITALDTNIVSGLWSGGLRADVIRFHLRVSSTQGVLLISPVVLAELLANPDLSLQALEHFLEKTGIQVSHEIQRSVWVLTGQRFARHVARRRKSIRQAPRRLVADFLIGAHALTYADRLMTLDETFYAQDFPELPLYLIPEA